MVRTRRSSCVLPGAKKYKPTIETSDSDSGSGEEDVCSSDSEQEQPSQDQELPNLKDLNKLPTEVFETMIAFLPSATLLHLAWHTSKQFHWITECSHMARSILFRFMNLNKEEPSLLSDYFHEAYLAGWILDNYPATIAEASDDAPLIDHYGKELTAEEVSGSSIFATCMHNDVRVTKLESVLKKCHLFSERTNGIFLNECMEELVVHFDTELFQTYSRLLSYSIDAAYNLVDVHCSSLAGKLIKQRSLNSYEKQLFKFVSSSHKQEQQAINSEKPLIHTAEQFEKNMNEEFCLNEWKSLLSWDELFLVGGSVLKCLLVDTFKSSSTQDVDLFWIGSDYYDWEKRQVKFEKKLQKKGFTVTSDGYGYVRSLNVTFSTGKKVTFQFIWYDDGMSPERILHIFDLDCCMVGYNGTNVLATWSFIQSINTGTMINYKLIENEEDRNTFMPRTIKYHERGYQLLVPGTTSEDQCEIIEDMLNGGDTKYNLESIKQSYTGFLLNNDSYQMRESFVDLLREQQGNA